MRMTSSGTEATMSAIRLARGYTKRDKIIKFEGCYHGHVDSLLVNAGSGAATFGVPSSPGIPNDLTKHTISLEYNNSSQVEACFKKYNKQIACVIVEPIAGNMNCVIPDKSFLRKIRTLCNKNNSILIFDEVMTGFRVAKGGAQQFFDVQPDITTLGKIVGGGLPVGVFGGKKKYMNQLMPEGPIYHAGTLSGNPVAMAAGITTIDLICKKNFHINLEKKTKKLMVGLKNAANKYNIDLQINYSGGMFGFFFTKNKKVKNFKDVSNCNQILFERFFKLMLKKEFILLPHPMRRDFYQLSIVIKISITPLIALKMFLNPLKKISLNIFF